MIFNHLRRTVFQAERDEPSLCPLCNEPLLARRGELIRWHWSHFPGKHGRECDWWSESDWHLRWKDAYCRNFRQWIAEYPVTLADGTRYIIDAANPVTGRYREFVHSLSPRYVDKHLDLIEAFPERDAVMWLWDGEAFASERRRHFESGCYTNLLKPRAEALYDVLGGLVHFSGALWYRREGEYRAFWVRSQTARVGRLLEAFNTRGCVEAGQ
jgi:hypothetical protein